MAFLVFNTNYGINYILNSKDLYKIWKNNTEQVWTCLFGCMYLYTSVSLYACTTHVHASSDIISVRPHWQPGRADPEGSMQSQPHYIWHCTPIICLYCAQASKASNTWASTLKCCFHIIENQSVFYRMWPFKAVQYVYEDVRECVCAVISQLWGIAFPHAVPILNRPLYLPPISVPPPSLRPSPLMDLADLVGHAIATRGPS